MTVTDWKSKTKGEQTELELKPLIANYLGVSEHDIIKQGEFDMIDFKVNDNIYIEIKERFVKSTTFADGMFPYHKYEYCLNKAKEGNEVYLFLKYFDCVVCYKFHSDSHKDFNFRSGGRNDRNKNETRWYSYLQSEKAIKV
jgi:hypothetical protein